MQTLPDLASCSEAFHLEPFPAFRMMEVAFDNLQLAQRLATWALSHSRTCNLRSVVDEEWQSMNAVVQHREEEALPDPPVQRGHKACRTYGIALCTTRGRKVYQFRNKFLQLLKALCKRKQVESRLLLQEGYIVVLFIQTPLPEETARPSFLLKRLSQAMQAEAEPLGEEAKAALSAPRQWFHVGLHYWKPYRPTFQRLQEVGEEEQHVKLQQTGEFYTEFDLFSQMPLECQWSVVLHRIVSTEAPVAYLQPSCCWVEALPGEAELCWSGGIKRRSKRQQAAGPKAKAQRAAQTQGEEQEMQSGVSLAETEVATREAEPEAMDSDSGSDLADEAEGEGEEQQEMEADAAEKQLEEQLQEVVDTWPRAHATEEALQDSLLLDTLLAPDNEHEEAITEAVLAETLADVAEEEPAPEVAEEQAQMPDAPLPPQPPAPADPLRRGGRSFVGLREKSEHSVTVPGGKVAYYHKGKFFQASCSNPAHVPKCVLSRSAEGGRKPSQGRPLGFLVAWLCQGVELPDKATHWNREAWPDHDARLACRQGLPLVEGGVDLLLCERERREGEGEEPEAIP